MIDYTPSSTSKVKQGASVFTNFKLKDIIRKYKKRTSSASSSKFINFKEKCLYNVIIFCLNSLLMQHIPPSWWPKYGIIIKSQILSLLDIGPLLMQELDCITTFNDWYYNMASFKWCQWRDIDMNLLNLYNSGSAPNPNFSYSLSEQLRLSQILLDYYYNNQKEFQELSISEDSIVNFKNILAHGSVYIPSTMQSILL